MWGIIRITASAESHMTKHPDKIRENIDFAAQELLEAPAEQRPAMLENLLITNDYQISIPHAIRWSLQDPRDQERRVGYNNRGDT